MPTFLTLSLTLLACGPAAPLTPPEASLEFDVDEKSICGTTIDWEEVEYADEVYQSWAPAAGMTVWDIGTTPIGDDDEWCSGALIAPNLFITAGHCLFDCSEMDVWFGYQTEGGAVSRADADVYQCEEIVAANERRTDYAVLRLSGEPGATYGWFEMNFATPAVGDDVVIIGHPGSDRPKKVSLGATTSVGTTAVYYQADTEGGMSGSPVLGADGRYVAVHTNGGCSGRPVENGSNFGRHMAYIYDNYDLLHNHDFIDQTASDPPEADDRFGAATATGDFDCDGIPDLAVGSPGQDGALGALSIRYGGEYGLEAGTDVYLDSPVGRRDEGYTSALVAADFDGDGCADLAVAAPGAEVDGVVGAGAVEIAWGRSSGLGSLERLDATDFGGVLTEGAGFGAALTAGDLDGDGQADLVAGAPEADGGAIGVLPGGGGAPVWLTEDALGADSTESGDRFGAALAIGDLDGDGNADLLVGAPGETLGAGRVGAGAVTAIGGDSFGAFGDVVQRFTADRPVSGEGFGAALAAGDFDGDGNDDAAVGVPGARGAGRVDAFYGSSSGLGGAVALAASFGLPTGDEAFGSTLLAADFDGDGVDELAAAAPGATVDGEAGSGRVVIFDDDLSSTREILQLDQSAPLADEAFGTSFSAGDFDLDGDADLVIGIPGQSLFDESSAGAVAIDHID